MTKAENDWVTGTYTDLNCGSYGTYNDCKTHSFTDYKGLADPITVSRSGHAAPISDHKWDLYQPHRSDKAAIRDLQSPSVKNTHCSLRDLNSPPWNAVDLMGHAQPVTETLKQHLLAGSYD